MANSKWDLDFIIKIAYFSWLGCMIFIHTPLILYYCHRLWKLGGKISSFNKRYPKYAIAYCLLMIFYMIVCRPIGDMPRIMNFQYFNQSEDKTYLIRLIFYNAIHAIYIMSLTRAWLLYIEYKKANQLMEMSWQQQIIDITKPDYKMPWTLRYTLLRHVINIYSQYFRLRHVYLNHNCTCS